MGIHAQSVHLFFFHTEARDIGIVLLENLEKQKKNIVKLDTMSSCLFGPEAVGHSMPWLSLRIILLQLWRSAVLRVCSCAWPVHLADKFRPPLHCVGKTDSGPKTDSRQIASK